MGKNHVVIIGGGFGGLSTFYGLNKHRHLFDITLIDARKESLEKPALPEVAFAGKPVENVRIPLQPVIERRGGKFINERVIDIQPKQNEIMLESGQTVSYDFLVIATGAIKDYDAIPGLKTYGFSICDDDMAPRLYERLQQFHGGPIVTGAALTEWAAHDDIKTLSAPCEGPIGEVMFMLDYELQHRGLREKSPIHVFTPGEIFFEDVGPDVHRKFEPLIEAHNITVHTNKKIQSIEKDHVTFTDGSTMEAELSIVIPPYKGLDILKEAGLGDEKGYVYTDDAMRHPTYRNVYAVGDINAKSMPKLGHIAVIQAQIAAASILHDVTGKGEIPPFKPEIFCIMDRGGHQATLILSDHMYGGSRDFTFSGPLVHLMKWSFDTYYYYTRGHLPPDFMQQGLSTIIEKIHR